MNNNRLEEKRNGGKKKELLYYIKNQAIRVIQLIYFEKRGVVKSKYLNLWL